MKHLFTTLAIFITLTASACSVTPVCGWGGYFTFRGDPGYSTFAHVQSVDVNGIPDGVYDSLHTFPLGTLQMFVVPVARIKVTWEEDNIVNFAESNGISCAPLAIGDVPNYTSNRSKKPTDLVSIYAGKVLVTSSKKDKVELSIITLDGRLINRNISSLKSGNNFIDLAVSGLPNGLYFIRGIFSDGYVSTLKFVKN